MRLARHRTFCVVAVTRAATAAACRLVALAALSLVLFASISCRSAPPAPNDVMVWRNVGAWSGRGNAQTGSFGSNTGALRVRWRTMNESTRDAGRFRVTLLSSVSGRALTVAVDQHGVGAGESIAAETSPVVYALVESTDIDWSLMVDEGLLGTLSSTDASREVGPEMPTFCHVSGVTSGSTRRQRAEPGARWEAMQFVGPQEATEPGWTLLREWSGQGVETVSESFSTTSRLYRIAWKISEVTRDGLIDLYVRDAQGLLVAVAGNLRAAQRPEER